MPRLSVTEINKKCAQLEARLNKGASEKGASVCTNIDLAPNSYFLRRPSGIIELDMNTGGGLPAGGLSYIGGVDGSGKTFLLNKYIAMNQRLWGEHSAVALAVSEAAPDHFFMRKCGVQIAIPEQMIAERVAARKNSGLAAFTKDEIKSFRAKTVGQVKLLRGATGEELLGALLECFVSGVFDLLCLDSVSAVLPDADAGKDLDENAKRAAAAGLLTKFFQHYLNGTTGYSDQNKTTVIFTTQVRSNSKKAEAPAHIAKYLPDYVAQGAWAAKHGKLIDIMVKPGEKDKEKTNVEVQTLGAAVEQRKKTVQVGKMVRFEIMKGKAGVHEGITGEFPFNYATLTDDQHMLVLQALQLGVAEEKNGVITFYDLQGHAPIPGLEKLPMDALTGMLRADFELELSMRLMLLASAGIECSYR
jgi:RecA/RadA recombinase